MNWPDNIEPDVPVADETLVWPPGPPRPHSFRRVFLCAAVGTGFLVGVTAFLLVWRGILDEMPWAQLAVSIAIAAGSLSAISRVVHERLNPGIPDLTSHELLLWSFWVTLLTLPTTLVLMSLFGLIAQATAPYLGS